MIEMVEAEVKKMDKVKEGKEKEVPTIGEREENQQQLKVVLRKNS